eukprot:10377_5
MVFRSWLYIKLLNSVMILPEWFVGASVSITAGGGSTKSILSSPSNAGESATPAMAGDSSGESSSGLESALVDLLSNTFSTELV